MGKKKISLGDKIVSKKNKKLLDESIFSDFTIIFHNDEKIKLHKCILSLNTDYFNDALEKGVNEIELKSENEEKNVEVFKSFIEFIYLNEISLDEEKLFDFLVIAEKVNKLIITNIK
jgi:hypothetical protein